MTKLWRTMLIVHFAKDARNPFVNSILRLSFALSGAAIVGGLLSKALHKTDLPFGIPNEIGFGTAAGCGFILSSLLMVTFAASSSHNAKTYTFSKVLWLCPVPSKIRWALQAMPNVIILSIVGTVFGLPIFTAASRMHLSGSIIITGWLLGLLSGLGLMLFQRPKRIIYKAGIMVVIIAAGARILDVLSKSESSLVQDFGPSLLSAIWLFPLGGLIQSYVTEQRALEVHTLSKVRQLIPATIPYKAWYAVKIWRNNRTRSSFLLAIFFTTCISLSIKVQHRTFSDPYAVLIIGAVLASMFACDLRGIMRRYAPPEPGVTCGIKNLVLIESLAAVGAGFIIGLPIVITLIGQLKFAVPFIIFYFCLQIFSSLVGLLSGTIFISENGETGIQFFSAAIATAILVAFPKLARLSEVAYAKQSFHWLAAGIMVGGIIYVIEFIRRRNYGHA